MRITLVDTPRHIAPVPRFTHILLRVISGDVLLGRDRQSISDGGGLPVAVADGIQNLAWDTGELWMSAATGTTAVAEVIVP